MGRLWPLLVGGQLPRAYLPLFPLFRDDILGVSGLHLVLVDKARFVDVHQRVPLVLRQEGLLARLLVLVGLALLHLGFVLLRLRAVQQLGLAMDGLLGSLTPLDLVALNSVFLARAHLLLALLPDEVVVHHLICCGNLFYDW